jgi:folate-dependent phosphoribosylglycinamide formyltransferase PurN
VLLLSGSHPRHAFVHQAILGAFDVCGAVLMQRESVLPDPPPGIDPHDADNFREHFAARDRVERREFGSVTADDVFASVPTHRCTPRDLNGAESAAFVAERHADVAFIFGVDLIGEPVRSRLPADAVNLHLGLSPWYRGSATLFWPFYNLQPQFAGVTFHQIVAEADAGEIIHQAVPPLRRGDGIHDVSARAVVDARRHAVALLEERAANGHWQAVRQRTPGRLYLSSQFRACHLRVVYDLFENDIVDHYLAGSLGGGAPRLVTSAWPGLAAAHSR